MDQARRTVVLGLCVLLMAIENNVYIDPRSMNLLCRAMLISSDLEKKTCPDLDDLGAQFPMAMKDRRSEGSFQISVSFLSLILCKKPDKKSWEKESKSEVGATVTLSNSFIFKIFFTYLLYC